MTDDKSQKAILALDVGTKTCGVARTDTLGITVQPVATLRYAGANKIHVVLSELEVIFKESEPQTIVVGLPYNMDGTEGTQARKVRDFIGALQNYLKKNGHAMDLYSWVFMDERCTSEEADAFLLTHDVSRKKRKAVLDKMAAVFILQRYLDELS